MQRNQCQGRARQRAVALGHPVPVRLLAQAVLRSKQGARLQPLCRVDNRKDRR